MKVNNILISQPEPAKGSPYPDIITKFGVNIDFKPFFKVEGVNIRDFRAQKINVLDYTAIIFSSRAAIDSFFKLCEEMRVTVPETMKYFCQSETIALYLQKYIVYRKRKIFFGTGTIASIIDTIGVKHKAESFLITCTDALKPEVKKVFTKAKLKCASAVLVKTVNCDLSGFDLQKYQLIVFYSPSDIRSLLENFPDFQQGETMFATYGPTTAKAMKAAKLKVQIEAPTPEAPSIAAALSLYLDKK